MSNGFNGWVKSLLRISAAVGAVGALIGAFLAVDNRYAHADALNELRDGQVRAVKEVRAETRYAADQLRKQLLEDKIFELTLIPDGKRTNVQRALLDRYKSQVQELNAKWVNPPASTLGAQ